MVAGVEDEPQEVEQCEGEQVEQQHRKLSLRKECDGERRRLQKRFHTLSSNSKQ